MPKVQVPKVDQAKLKAQNDRFQRLRQQTAAVHNVFCGVGPDIAAEADLLLGQLQCQIDHQDMFIEEIPTGTPWVK
jgi:hypothetical protein